MSAAARSTLSFKSMKTVEDNLMKSLVDLGKRNLDRTQNNAGFDWIVSITLNANQYRNKVEPQRSNQ